jgi:CRISPR-associated protein (TIGR03986 family)
LPERIYEPGDPFAQHDKLDPARHHGCFDLEIRTETELYTRCAYPPSEEGSEVGDSRLRQDFYHHGDPDRPAIPGSSLRGMLRSLVEILSYSRITRRPAPGQATRLRDERLVHRAVADRQTAVGKAYNERFCPERGPRGALEFDYPGANVQAGYLEGPTAGSWRIRPARRVQGTSFVRVTMKEVARAGVRPVDNTVARIWVEPAPVERHPTKGKLALWYARTKRVETTPAQGLEEGRLVCSGPMATRRMHTIVYAPDPAATPLLIPQPMWEQFEQDRNMQRGIALRKIESTGDPLFYLVDRDGRLVFFGPTLFFRVPYELHTGDFVPSATTGDFEAPLDLAESVFGTVNGPRRNDRPNTGAFRGRVTFEDARLVAVDGGGTPFLGGPADGVRWPAILSSPKPTSYQNYLVQTDPTGDRGRLHGYTRFARGQTALRGFKRYWHRGPAGDALASAAPAAHQTQYTAIRPLRSGVTFRGRVHFENLEDVELGALLAALELPASCRHQLGLGKPLGMGSVRITLTTRLVDPRRRYASLEASGVLSDDEARPRLERAREAFRQCIVEHHNKWTLSPRLDAARATLWDIPRLGDLRRLLEWDARPAREATKTLELDEFKARPVLPTPAGVTGQHDVDVDADVGPPVSEASSTVAGAALGATPPTRSLEDASSRPAEAPPLVRGGRIVRFSEAGVELLIDGEARPRKVRLHTAVFPLEAWKKLSGGVLRHGRRVKIESSGERVTRVLPEES